MKTNFFPNMFSLLLICCRYVYHLDNSEVPVAYLATPLLLNLIIIYVKRWQNYVKVEIPADSLSLCKENGTILCKPCINYSSFIDSKT